MTRVDFFGLAFNEHGNLVRVQVIGRLYDDVEFFGPVMQAIDPAAISSSGRAYGECAWIALGAAHVRRA